MRAGDGRQRLAFPWSFRSCEAKLSEIFFATTVDEKTGRGIPIISSKYDEGHLISTVTDINVTIPFRFLHEVGNKVGNKTEENGLSNPRT